MTSPVAKISRNVGPLVSIMIHPFLLRCEMGQALLDIDPRIITISQVNYNIRTNLIIIIFKVFHNDYVLPN